jgi:hypothetical protein
MTKKDFELIAAVLVNTPLQYADPEHARMRLAEEFARVLSEGNPRFKRELFIQAATGAAPAARSLASDLAEDR